MKLVADHIPSNTTATFGVDSQNGATQSVTIPIVRDRTTENAETFTVLVNAAFRLRLQALCLEAKLRVGDWLPRSSDFGEPVLHNGDAGH